jgi:hypothetical protein
LDGTLPRTDAIEDKEGSKQAKAEDAADDVKAAMRDRAKARADEEAFDHPYGQGQQDYLHRLAKSLRQEDERLRRVGDGSRIKAIGVLGSDVFDKLLVLRALKPLFPQAQFFTTDFDYTLTMSSELGWTRNLLIASSFGPTLDPKIQCQIPPFRGSYETSAFLATQLALDGVEREVPSLLAFDDVKPAVPSLSLKARVFEIERTGEVLPLPLTVLPKPGDDNGSDQQPCAENIHRLQTKNLSDFPIQPKDEQIYPKPREPRGLHWLAGLLSLPIALSLAYLFVQARAQNEENNKPSDPLKESKRHNKIIGRCLGFVVQNIEVLSVFIVLVAAACLSAFWDKIAYILTEYGKGEPISFIQGVSLWPSVMLRLLTVLTSLISAFRPSKAAAISPAVRLAASTSTASGRRT